MLIAPSILAADFLHLAQDVETINACGDWIHLDIMDGSLVPNISFGFSVVDAVAKIAAKPMDVHLMIVNPDKYIPRFAKAGASYISFHLEAADIAGKDVSEYISLTHDCGVKAGIAINPDIPVERLFPYLEEADFFLVMSVFAGFGGQTFIEDSIGRIATLKSEMSRRGISKDIEVDGGVSASNARVLAEAGATMLVAGSSVFKAEDPARAIAEMRV